MGRDFAPIRSTIRKGPIPVERVVCPRVLNVMRPNGPPIETLALLVPIDNRNGPNFFDLRKPKPILNPLRGSRLALPCRSSDLRIPAERNSVPQVRVAFTRH